MDVKVHVNMYVKVKLTDVGVSILKEQHEELNKTIQSRGGKGMGEFELRLDEDGYYKTPMWSLMSKFGHQVGLAKLPPFELDIIVIGH